MSNPVADAHLADLASRDPAMAEILRHDRAAAVLVAEQLRNRCKTTPISPDPASHRLWELAGLYFKLSGRFHEALVIFDELYRQMLAAQTASPRMHKGMPLVWMSDCYAELGFPVHAKRYLMLTLVEDALREGGNISPRRAGVYFRLVWHQGHSDAELKRYAQEFQRLAELEPEYAGYPEALLQLVDDDWVTELPSPAEALHYRVTREYASFLLSTLGDGSGRGLERLAEYLLACMPGCRTKRRQRSGSTDYDVICSMEGFDVDFRSELGRYFVCECKDWARPADFTTIAKFCRVLDSTKAKFGILFSCEGISGANRTAHAGLEQIKVFQDRGIVVVAVTKADLERVAAGSNFINLLRRKYEAVRLDLRDA